MIPRAALSKCGRPLERSADEAQPRRGQAPTHMRTQSALHSASPHLLRPRPLGTSRAAPRPIPRRLNRQPRCMQNTACACTERIIFLHRLTAPRPFNARETSSGSLGPLKGWEVCQWWDGGCIERCNRQSSVHASPPKCSRTGQMLDDAGQAALSRRGVDTARGPVTVALSCSGIPPDRLVSRVLRWNPGRLAMIAMQ